MQRKHKIHRTIEDGGRQYVSVTSAMAIMKTLIGEPPDSYGPPALAAMHAAEGQAAHAICLDWLAVKHGWLPELTLPPRDPVVHPDEQRWANVLCVALAAFQQWTEEYQVEPIGIEQEAFSAAYGLVGHADLFCWITRGFKKKKVVVDLKFTTSILETHRLQVRCYSRLDGLKEALYGMIWQCDRNTGTYKPEVVQLTQCLDDVAAVSHAAHLWAWKERKRQGAGRDSH